MKTTRTKSAATLIAATALLLSACTVEQKTITPQAATTTTSASNTNNSTSNNSPAGSSNATTTSSGTSTARPKVDFPISGTIHEANDASKISYGFFTPSKNIGCYTSYDDSPMMLYCMAKNWQEEPNMNQTPFPKLNLVGFDNSYLLPNTNPDGVALSPGRGALPAVQRAHGYYKPATREIPDSWVVPYGSTASHDRYSCDIDFNGITCHDLVAHHAFFMNRDGAKVLY
ncbi:MAG: hypothetical protein Q3962_09425 [Corynebacterium sp.]|nr:hypothetical protein [Corynebacterium sp.]